MSEHGYVPTTEEVRSRYFQGLRGYGAAQSAVGRLVAEYIPLRTSSSDEFDRWLATERARVWDECAEANRKKINRVWSDWTLPGILMNRDQNPYRNDL